MEQTTQNYELWLAADFNRARPIYDQAAIALQTFCQEHGATIIDHSDASAPIVSLTDEAKEAIIASDLLEQLAVPGDHPAIFPQGTVMTHEENYALGLTA